MENLWWLTTDPKWTDGLQEKLMNKEEFLTFRLGAKWFRNLNPWDVVNISVTDDPKNPSKRHLGQAEVLVTIKDTIRNLRNSGTAMLYNNIGAKDWDQVLKDMKEVYGENKVTEDSVVTAIELRGK